WQLKGVKVPMNATIRARGYTAQDFVQTILRPPLLISGIRYSTNSHFGFKASDRKSTRLNSSHSQISYAVFCLKKKKKTEPDVQINGDLKCCVRHCQLHHGAARRFSLQACLDQHICLARELVQLHSSNLLAHLP